MKCPYRTIYRRTADTSNVLGGDMTADVMTEEFAECYGGECPFYQAPAKINEHIHIVEGCKRVTIDERKSEKGE